MQLFDSLYNKYMFKKYDVKYATFPAIYGRIMIANFARSGAGSIKFGKNVVINSGLAANPVGGVKTVLLFKNNGALIEIDDCAGISNALIAAYEYVYIGKNVNIGAGVKIMDTDFHSPHLTDRMNGDINIPHKPVRIKDGAFIGTEAIILKGVTIGEEAIVGAGSIVAKDVPAGEIWCGNPAKFIKKIK
jgi:acetyltransferase-like isoleucine patch superfamily enzyme